MPGASLRASTAPFSAPDAAPATAPLGTPPITSGGLLIVSLDERFLLAFLVPPFFTVPEIFLLVFLLAAFLVDLLAAFLVAFAAFLVPLLAAFLVDFLATFLVERADPDFFFAAFLVAFLVAMFSPSIT